jgi:hypothetical protein
MEGISRVDLDRISQMLSNYVNTDESIQLAEKLTKFDIIPKLYVYTYFKKILSDMNDFNISSRDNEFELFETHIENLPQLGLQGIKSLRDARKVFEVLHNGFKREDNIFCDFDDSKFHDKTKMGVCECNVHSGKEIELLFPTYDGNEELGKYDDHPYWWCQKCCDIDRDYDCDYAVTCDMEIED